MRGFPDSLLISNKAPRKHKRKYKNMQLSSDKMFRQILHPMQAILHMLQLIIGKIDYNIIVPRNEMVD